MRTWPVIDKTAQTRMSTLLRRIGHGGEIGLCSGRLQAGGIWFYAEKHQRSALNESGPPEGGPYIGKVNGNTIDKC